MLDDRFFGPEHEDFRGAVREFVEREVAPHLDEWDERHAIDRSTWLAAGKQGLLGLSVPGLGFALTVVVITLVVAALTHDNLVWNARIFADTVDMRQGDVTLAALPFFHSFGQTCVLNASLVAGPTPMVKPVLVVPVQRHDVPLHRPRRPRTPPRRGPRRRTPYSSGHPVTSRDRPDRCGAA